jgi:hypothetical protein
MMGMTHKDSQVFDIGTILFEDFKNKRFGIKVSVPRIKKESPVLPFRNNQGKINTCPIVNVINTGEIFTIAEIGFHTDGFYITIHPCQGSHLIPSALGSILPGLVRHIVLISIKP